MNKEELENRKLERRAKEWFVKDKEGSTIQSLVNLIKEFTEPGEKRIAELEEQVKKMKCCRICAYYEDLGISDWSPCKTCENNSNWEFAD